MKNIYLLKYQSVLLITISSFLYFFFAYFLERQQFSNLTIVYIGLFICYFFIIKLNEKQLVLLTGLTLLFRLIFLFSIPNLSQDFYRFIWDGRMLLEGYNPYLSLPETFIQQGTAPVFNASNLYIGMGSLNGSHFTNYPPLNQLCFLIAALFASKSILGSVIVMRTILILADLGILYFGQKLLKAMHLRSTLIFWYLLNPFIIIELTGNLHFEPLMLFFLIWSLYKLQQHQWIKTAILIACSVSVKLIPLLFLPLFYQWFVKQHTGIKNSNSTAIKTLKAPQSSMSQLSVALLKLIAFYSIVVGVSLLLFLPFTSEKLIENYMNSVGLWFQNFEFNASFYYLFREIGYLFRGYNEIAIIGKIIPLFTILFLIGMAFFRKNNSLKQLITALLFGLSFYYFMSTTIHPWYLATLVLLSVFTKYRFPIIWSATIVFSYSAYATPTFQENFWLLGLEYSIMYGFLVYELFYRKKTL